MRLTGTITPKIGAYLHVEPQGQRITALPEGTEVEIDGRPARVDGYDWFRVRVKSSGCCGFVGAEFVAVQAPKPDVPHPHPRPAPAPARAHRPIEPRRQPMPAHLSDEWILAGAIAVLALAAWALSSLL